jgi:hypothetical protein
MRHLRLRSTERSSALRSLRTPIRSGTLPGARLHGGSLSGLYADSWDRTRVNLLPCATCPWRVDQNASVIPRYNHKKACGLMNTVGDSDALREIMACHRSTEDEPRACNGYLAREGWSNLNVRILLFRGQLPSPSAVLDACEAAGIELHPDYPSVLQKLKESL